VTTQAPTCTVTLPASSLDLTPVTVADFATSPVKKGGKTFTVTVSGCSGTPTAGTSLYLTLWGTPDTTKGDTTLFKNILTSGQAAGVGFELTNDTTGKGASLPAKGSSTPYAIPVTLDAKTGEGTVDFFAMPSRGGYAANAVTGGAMRTTLNFNIDYH
jgi:type 1 fimbria pilin